MYIIVRNYILKKKIIKNAPNINIHISAVAFYSRITQSALFGKYFWKFKILMDFTIVSNFIVVLQQVFELIGFACVLSIKDNYIAIPSNITLYYVFAIIAFCLTGLFLILDVCWPNSPINVALSVIHIDLYTNAISALIFMVISTIMSIYYEIYSNERALLLLAGVS